MQPPQSLKITLKLKPEKSDDNPLTTVDSPSNNVEGVDQVDSSSTQAFKNDQTTEDDQNENSNYQMVLYDPEKANHTIETEPIPAGPTSLRPNLNQCSNQASRYLPSSEVGAFTVQCDNCFKWRIIPTKEKYEQIREHNTEKPFVCEAGREWRPEISCDDPPDMIPDGSRLWAIDKPNIAQAPPGWERILRIRAEGGSKFADVYYVAPSGKRLRSMVEIQRYFNENPEHLEDSVNLSRFSFQTPTPLRENYVRKRPANATPGNDAGDYGMPQSVPTEVQPISWMRPDVDTSLHLSGPTMSPDSTANVKSAKKKRGLTKRSCDGELVYNQNDVGISEPRQL